MFARVLWTAGHRPGASQLELVADATRCAVAVVVEVAAVAASDFDTLGKLLADIRAVDGLVVGGVGRHALLAGVAVIGQAAVRQDTVHSAATHVHALHSVARVNMVAVVAGYGAGVGINPHTGATGFAGGGRQAVLTLAGRVATGDRRTVDALNLALELVLVLLGGDFGSVRRAV